MLHIKCMAEIPTAIAPPPTLPSKFLTPAPRMFFLSFLGRILRVDLITWVRPTVRTSVGLSVRPQKVSLISMKFGT